MDHLLHLKKLAPLLRECFDSVLPSGVQPDEAMFHILDYAMDVQGQQKTTHCLIADDRVYSVFQKTRMIPCGAGSARVAHEDPNVCFWHRCQKL